MGKGRCREVALVFVCVCVCVFGADCYKDKTMSFARYTALQCDQTMQWLQVRYRFYNTQRFAKKRVFGRACMALGHPRPPPAHRSHRSSARSLPIFFFRHKEK